MRQWTFGYHEMRGISWLAEKRLAFQEDKPHRGQPVALKYNIKMKLFCPSSGALDCVLQLVLYFTHEVAGHCPATSWVYYTTSCNTQSRAPEDVQNNFPKHVELTGIINKSLLLHLVGCLYYLYQWCTVKQISDNEIYLLIKYIKSVLWREVKRLS